MLSKTFFHFLIRKQPFNEKVRIGINFIRIYYNFSKMHYNCLRSRKFNKIYHDLKEQNIDINNFFKMQSKDDLSLLDSLFSSDVKQFLNKNNLQADIIPSKKIGMHQVGFNTIYVENPDSFWTTGKATFFVPTKPKMAHDLIVEVSSVPEINVIIGLENEIIQEIIVPKFSEKKIQISLPSSKIKNNISKIFISTDKLWKPDILQNKKPKVVFGIRIDSIRIKNS